MGGLTGHVSPSGAGPQVGHAGVTHQGGGRTDGAGEMMNLGVGTGGLFVVGDGELVGQPTSESSAVSTGHDGVGVAPVQKGLAMGGRRSRFRTAQEGRSQASIRAFRDSGRGLIWQTFPVIFRLAHPAEAPLLSDLALRSKRHWGYDDDFMNRCRPQLMVDPDQITRGSGHAGRRRGGGRHHGLLCLGRVER